MAQDGEGIFTWGVAFGVGILLASQHFLGPKLPWWLVPGRPAVLDTPPLVRPIGQLQIGTDAADANWTLDADSVHGPRTKRLGWVAIVSSPKEKIKTDVRNSVNLYQINCETTATRILSGVGYDAKGEIVFHSEIPDSTDKYFPPKTLGGMVVEALCMPSFDIARKSPNLDEPMPPLIQTISAPQPSVGTR